MFRRACARKSPRRWRTTSCRTFTIACCCLETWGWWWKPPSCGSESATHPPPTVPSRAMYDLLLGTLLFTGAVLTGDTVMLDRSIAILQEAAAFERRR